jgi:2-polyprenyl-6-hydroxyphenyl methylase/3-demethylubiquinone-9 3-methyltransferase
MASSTWPDLTNYATYPAVNWFSYYGLKAFLGKRGFHTMDRFDIALTADHSGWRRVVLELIDRLPPLRFLGHVVTPGLTLIAVKDGAHLAIANRQ